MKKKKKENKGGLKPVWGPSLGNCLLARSLEGRKRGVYKLLCSTTSVTSLTASTSIKNQLLKFSKRFSWKTPWPDLRNDIEASVRGIGALGSPKFATLYCNSPSCLAPALRNVSLFYFASKATFLRYSFLLKETSWLYFVLERNW